MSALIQRETPGKDMLRAIWRSAQTASVLASSLTSGRSGLVRLYFGGARSGDLGGPRVKIKRLSEHFPESRWQYNLVYLLSGAPYLSATAIDWLKMRRIPVVLNQNGVMHPGWRGGDWRKMNAIMATAYHRADHVFWQSSFCRRVADSLLGKREGTGEVLFNAIDTRNHFLPTKERTARPFTFLLTGRIDAHMSYRVESSITGLRAARDAGLDCRLIVAGWIDSPALAVSQNLAFTLGVTDHVDFYGPYTQAMAPMIYQSADAYVMTKYLDPCPNTVLEAMACGLPILYSASGGVAELVGPDAGVGLKVEEDWEGPQIVPTSDAIAAGMLEIYENSNKMSIVARHRAESKFDIAHWIDRHEKVFRNLLEAK